MITSRFDDLALELDTVPPALGRFQSFDSVQVSTCSLVDTILTPRPAGIKMTFWLLMAQFRNDQGTTEEQK